MTSTTADYADRRADVLAFRGVFPQARGRSQLLAQELARPGDGGAQIAGVEKLAQRVLLVMLMRQGSRLYRPSDGTTFMTDARRGLWRTPADVEQSFHAARPDAVRQIRADEADTDPADERLASIDLAGVTLSGDQVAVRMTLTSAAGTGFAFLTPITVPLR
jgi:hypothetical protein